MATMTYAHTHAAIQTHRNHPEHSAKKRAHAATTITGIAMTAFAIQRLSSNDNTVTIAQDTTLITGIAAFIAQSFSHSKHVSDHEPGRHIDHIHQGFNIASGLLGLGFAAFVITKAAGFDLAKAILIGDDALHTATKVAGTAGLGITMLLNLVDTIRRHRAGTATPPAADTTEADTTRLVMTV